MKKTRRITALILSLMMVLSYMPAMAFADDGAAAEPVSVEADADIAEEVQDADVEAADAEAAGTEAAEPAEDAEALTEEDLPEDEDAVYDDTDESDFGFGELSSGERFDAEGLDAADPEEQAEEFFFGDDSEEVMDGQGPKRVLSVKGDRLTGNNLKYYNTFKSIITQVSAGSRKATSKDVSVASWLGKTSFTAKDLGVSYIGYMVNGEWAVSDAAQAKLNKMFYPGSWSVVCTALLHDLSNTSYWVDWYSTLKFYTFYKCSFHYNSNRLYFDPGACITFNVPVIPEFAEKVSGSTEVNPLRADQTKISAAKAAKANARGIVNEFKNQFDTSKFTAHEVDVLRLYYYCDYIAKLTSYDDDAADNDNIGRGSPWSWISVFDFDTSTKAVCAGYARAFKYLCDLSKFNSRWIDCQIASGLAVADIPDSNHMWNIVRMDDGLNYLVDPTWMDEDKENVDLAWFLRGDPEGTSTKFTIDGVPRVYDDWFIATYPAAERKLAAKVVYTTGYTRKITLKRPTIKTPAGGRKKITVKWKAVTSPYRALYVDGYQVRYSTKSSMSGAKKVTVKGYKKASRTIKKLKSGRYYYVQVRTYAKMGGKTFYSKWSTKKKVRVK